MWTQLHWVDGPWPGRLALASRPRGGDWLPDEIASWRRSGADAVLSLLTPGEEIDLDLGEEANEARKQNVDFMSFPIRDRDVPDSELDMTRSVAELERALSSGKNVVVHCRQGIGRTGLVAACLLVSSGISPEAAVEKLSAARGLDVPETPGQRQWIDHYAASVAA